MNTATRNTKDSIPDDLTTETTPPAVSGLMTDLMRFVVFAACLTVSALFLKVELAPISAGVASGLLDPHTLGQALGKF